MSKTKSGSGIRLAMTIVPPKPLTIKPTESVAKPVDSTKKSSDKGK